MNTHYLSPAAFKEYQSELQQLLREERPKVVSQVSAAAALGDRSENAEYIYGKKRLREIDRRIRFLAKRLENSAVVRSSDLSGDSVRFGTRVTLSAEDKTIRVYQIVGPDEIDPAKGRITFASPLGKLILGKKVGDVVLFSRPSGDVELEIIKIEVALSDED